MNSSTMGAFSGEPKTIWLTETGDDRRMRLLEAFSFTDPRGTIWDAPANSIVDGASIPRPLWTLVGSPYTGDYRRASVPHDVACVRAGSDVPKRRVADRMFYEACRAGGCSVREATILYMGVRVGAIWPLVPQWEPARQLAVGGARLDRSAIEERMEADFRQAAEIVLSKAEVDDAEEIERRTDRALATVTLVDVERL